MKINNFIFSKSITWQAYEGKVIKVVKNTMHFENVSLSETLKPGSYLMHAGWY